MHHTERTVESAMRREFASLGADVQSSDVPGYSDAMVEPHNTKVPGRVVHAITEWLVRAHPRVSTPSFAAPERAANAPFRIVSPGVRERPVFLDTRNRLFGIVSEPAHGRCHNTGIVLANAGAVSRVGPNRLYVTMAREWAAGPGVILFCGRFEGLDERVIEARGMQEVAVGEAVLAGGEAAALVLLEACVRLIPGVLGNDASLAEESFAGGLLEQPHYTRPREWEGRAIPEVLLSGDHARIEAWRRAERERITAQRRPDLKRRPSTD